MNADKPGGKQDRRLISSGWVGVIAIVAGVLLWFSWPVHMIPFDSESWKLAGQSRKPETRHAMVEDLRRRFDRGDVTTAAEILSLLGPPEMGQLGPSGSVRYNLGPERSAMFKVDNDWLHLTFDETGHVRSHDVIPD
jgi:hypothetical protein